MNRVTFSCLNEKEKSILGLWICGQSAKQSGAYLERSGRTVEYHRERIKCKLGIYRASELFRLALGSPEFDNILRKGRELIVGKSQKNNGKKD